MIKKAENSLCILSGEIGRHINFGRELVFSADLCYNWDNEKASLYTREPLDALVHL